MSRGPWKRTDRPVNQVMAIEDLPVLCTSAEVGRLLRLTPHQITVKANAGELRGYKEGQEWRFPRTELEAYIERKITGREVSA